MRTKWGRRFALLFAIWISAEVAAYGGLYVLRRAHIYSADTVASTNLAPEQRETLARLLSGDPGYLAFSQTLGWTNRPGGAAQLYHANSQGLRANRDYQIDPPAGETRVEAFGDSFTHGDDVPDTATWEVEVEHDAPELEVMNFGVGGYGLDQEYLRWRAEGTRFHPRIVLIGFLTENINRQVNVYRPFYVSGSRVPLAKPRFEMKADTLALDPNPFSQLDGYRKLLDHPTETLEHLGEHDYFYNHRTHTSVWNKSPLVRLTSIVRHELLERESKPVLDGAYNVKSEAFAITEKLFDRFVSEVRASGETPLIVVFPTIQDFQRLSRGEVKGHQALLNYFAKRGYDYVDVLDAFPECRTKCDVRNIIPGHFSPEGNRVVGKFMAHEIETRLSGSDATRREHHG